MAPRPGCSWSWGEKIVVSIFHLPSPNDARTVLKIIYTTDGQLLSRIDSKVGFGNAMANAHSWTVSVVESHCHVRHVEIVNCVSFINILNLRIPFFSVIQVHYEVRKCFSIAWTLHSWSKSQNWCIQPLEVVDLLNFVDQSISVGFNLSPFQIWRPCREEKIVSISKIGSSDAFYKLRTYKTYWFRRNLEMYLLDRPEGHVQVETLAECAQTIHQSWGVQSPRLDLLLEMFAVSPMSIVGRGLCWIQRLWSSWRQERWM